VAAFSIRFKNNGLRGIYFDTPERGHYDTRPMSMPPDRPLDALGLARSGAVIEREFPIAAFARLRDRLAETGGTAAVRAEFRRHGEVPTAELAVKARVVLECQRCLGPMPQELESVARLAFAPEDAPGVPPDYEAIGGSPHRVDLASLVEDELLLSLPLLAVHGPGEACGTPGTPRETRDEKAREMRRPFAGLKDLMKR
jgi:uncharacterized protein